MILYNENCYADSGGLAEFYCSSVAELGRKLCLICFLSFVGYPPPPHIAPAFSKALIKLENFGAMDKPPIARLVAVVCNAVHRGRIALSVEREIVAVAFLGSCWVAECVAGMVTIVSCIIHKPLHKSDMVARVEGASQKNGWKGRRNYESKNWEDSACVCIILYYGRYMSLYATLLNVAITTVKAAVFVKTYSLWSFLCCDVHIITPLTLIMNGCTLYGLINMLKFTRKRIYCLYQNINKLLTVLESGSLGNMADNMKIIHIE